ncbi:MAG: YHS domain-containing protein [Balneola sp.]|nr:YHS domain-containing protein [Balneola sp.]|tara:strand:- start:2895 stop:3062 length:168 start_codon:yes stop_codon:yes gene_type:complete
MAQEKYTCPVMENPVEDINAASNSEYRGSTYYFCCPPCKDKFDENPEKYIQGRAN